MTIDDRVAAVEAARKEGARLLELEGVIRKGLATFIEVGQALLEIRDGRLYRSEFDAFGDYCRERWARRRLAQLADAGLAAAGALGVCDHVGGDEQGLCGLPQGKSVRRADAGLSRHAVAGYVAGSRISISEGGLVVRQSTSASAGSDRRDCLRTRRIGARCDTCGQHDGVIHLPIKLRGFFCELCCPVCARTPEAKAEPGIAEGGR